MPKAGGDKGGSDTLALDKGAFLFKAGDDSRDVYVVQEGVIELLGPEGGRPLARLGPGEPFGELAALDQVPRECSARAAEASRVLKIAEDAFGGLLGDPAVVAPLLRRLSRRLSAALAAAAKKAAAPGRLRFVHASSGKEFPLPAAGDAVVGRADPKSGFQPEIELSGEDPKRSLSRKHARVSVKEGEVFVAEEPRVTNGTYVNGVRLKSGTSARIADGDQVRFGLVETVFRDN